MSDWQPANASQKGGSSTMENKLEAGEDVGRLAFPPIAGECECHTVLARIRQCIMKLKMYMPLVPAVHSRTSISQK